MKYIIDEKELTKLLASYWELNNLYNYGVDNWEGMSEIDEDDKFTAQDVSNYIKENYEKFESKGE